MLRVGIVVLIRLLLGDSALGGTWTRTAFDTIQFEGKIEPDEFEKYSAVTDDNVRLLIVDSGGGETSAAMKIGFALRKSAIEIQVRRWCLSSCANYLFLGAVKRSIVNGIVGFHGNVQACFGDERWDGVAKELEAKGLSKSEIESFRLSTLKQIEDERVFLANVGVSQDLFDVSCEQDKGMGDGDQYAFLLPLPSTFSKYGVTKIIGEQDLDIVRAFPAPLAIR